LLLIANREKENNSMRKISKLLLASAICISFLALPISVLAADVTIKGAGFLPAAHPTNEHVFKKWGAEVTKRTDGQVNFKWFLGGTLAQVGNSLPSLQAGLIDAMFPTPIWAFQSEFPVTNSLLLPFLTDSSAHAARLLALMYENIPEMRKEFEAAKVVPFGFGSSDPINLHFKGDPAKVLADMKGKKIAVPSGFIGKIVGGFGATPVVLKPADFYTTIQRGGADGAALPDVYVQAAKLTDLLQSHSMVEFDLGPHVFLMSQKKWDSLPANVQSVIKELTPSLGCKNSTVLKMGSDKVVEGLKKRGDNFFYPTKDERAAWAKPVAAFYKGKAAGLTKAGMDGQAIIDKIVALADQARKDPCKPVSW
jgi:TRAP-type C4-dicarboxylate transport system substrate-binding protein